ncbi:DNA glycosylase AlkZ-like family protein [Plantactinospora sp. KLBMP9567]|uniref:DNA glycosylase AlkZ-like family protein n=1 Tax=Plantactinospora sp. KLBMP9567 TaxID=3085900 RepID=UPI002981206C|nr:crosslink repair DNA glycosylase YcaQ family protein [Plantactinospora sp. KLBMP9567]MDW5327144.1 crosslink repair DNA glycosylase YcaQ family protein [Plantactinospora sp. KLBMP9567]
MPSISLKHAQVLAIAAQRLTPPAGSAPDPRALLEDLGCIQIDTINVVRRSHELVLLTRGVPSDPAQAALGTDAPAPLAFEYYAHAACFVPLRFWPLFAFRRRQFQAGRWTGPTIQPEAVTHVRNLIDDSGAVTVRDLGGSQGSGWDRSSPLKWAAEWLLATGELACVRRQAWMRQYAPSTGVIPAEVRHDDLDDESCLRRLCQIALAALGVATADDIADYFRLPGRLVARIVPQLPDVVPVAVESWKAPAFTTADHLDTTPAPAPALTALSPFDSLIWHRPRMMRLFGVAYKLEAYLPPDRRECGYFGLPVLHNGQIVGRVALRCTNGVAQVEGVQIRDAEALPALRLAAEQAAQWAKATVDSHSWPALAAAAPVR